MKQLKTIGLGLAVAMAFVAFAAGTASATTLEITGVTQNQSVKLRLSEKAGTSMSQHRTDGTYVATCYGGETELTTSSFTGSSVTAPINTVSGWWCGGGLTIHNAGQLYIEHIAGTTDGTVFSEETHMTLPSPFGVTNCKTGAGTHLGTLKGTAAGNATLTINTVVKCGFILPSVTWKTEYIVTSPHGLGVVA
ncbi:MAG: hypothetical protein M3Y75_07680 [Actinomycetota bacterium]|nr:hypothetical protein [Actinomycetota bacterium]